MALSAAVLAQSGAYSVIEMEGLSGGNSVAMDINLNGDVVGRSGRLHGTETRAFLWTPQALQVPLRSRVQGKTQALSLDDASANSRATGINNRGVIVGYGETNDSMRAFLWSRRGGYVDLGALPGDKSSKAEAINEAGQVVGSSSGPQGQFAFLWTPGSGFRNLGALPGGQLSEARGINNQGHVVGSSGSTSGTHAFLWTPAGMEDLGTLPNDTSSVAYAINDSGQVVGSSSGPFGVRAFLWTRSSGMRDLGALPGSTYTEAYSINGSGQVVGISGTSAGTRAALWIPGATPRDLNSLLPQEFELILAGATEINDRGWILAFGSHMREVTSDRSVEHGQHTSPSRMFLLTPNNAF
jgi:probable HAF family extracellular repeat protein